MSYNNEYIEWSEWDSEKNNCLENNNFIDFINNNSIGFQPSTPIESKSINSWIRMLSLIGKAILTSFPVSSSYTSIGPSSNIDDIVTFIQDEFSTKISNEINKIKPNAWEQRKFNVDMDGTPIEFTTYNPNTDINVPVNAQKTFTDKDTYSLTESINSYSYSFSFTIDAMFGNVFTYAICVDPSLSLTDIMGPDSISKNGIILQNISGSENGTFDRCNIYINCNELTTEKIKIGDGYIEGISNTYDTSDSGIILSASVINYNYLRKSTASDIYLTKTDASNTYLTKTDASNTYATMNALKPLQNTYFDADLTTAGLAKIQANATIGTSITLLKDTDFIEDITNTDLSHRTVIFTLYRDDNEEVYISENIKLDIVNTTEHLVYRSRSNQAWFGFSL